MTIALAADDSFSVWFAQAIERSLEPANRSAKAAGVASVALASTSWSERSFCDFHRRNARPLAAYVQQSTRNPTVTEDIVQESFLRFLRAERAPGTEQHARNYLFRIATNLMRDRHRRRDLEVPVEHDADRLPSKGSHQQQVALQHDMQRSLAELLPRDRQILWLAHVEELTHREVAAVMGLREVSVRPMLFRSRKRLARQFASDGLQHAGMASAAASSTTKHCSPGKAK